MVDFGLENLWAGTNLLDKIGHLLDKTGGDLDKTEDLLDKIKAEMDKIFELEILETLII